MLDKTKSERDDNLNDGKEMFVAEIVHNVVNNLIEQQQIDMDLESDIIEFNATECTRMPKDDAETLLFLSLC